MQQSRCLEGANFDNPLAAFFSDQNKKPENRAVPFIQLKTDNALAPFHEWNRENSNA
jgi:guanine deaminase